jgi:hypothetical protein
MLWRDAVVAALERYAARHATSYVSRKGLRDEELARIISDAASAGRTPHQTLSRILQELRDEGDLEFLGDGNYLLLNRPSLAEDVLLTDEALEVASARNLLRFSVLRAEDAQVDARRRIGQAKIRQATLANYGQQCALCDVAERVLLVASHAHRWADCPEARGDLTNVICMCKFHDALFEDGYFSLTDDYAVIRRPHYPSVMIQRIMDCATGFRTPRYYPPAARFLAEHRQRTGWR